MLPLAVLGLAGMVSAWYPARTRVLNGVNDFENLYSGARLIGTPGQYDPEQYRAVQSNATGFYGQSWLYTRLPAFAIPLRPLGHLPYRLAYGIWQMMSLAALAGFIALWKTANKGLFILACCWSYPLSAVFAQGQDDTFLLLWLASALWLAARRPAVAGAFLALGLMKFHLFVLVPVALLGVRRWRMLGGFSAMAAVVFGLCFFAAGPRWPVQYLRLLSDKTINPEAELMPNLHGLFAGVPFSTAIELAASVAVAACVWYIARRSDLPVALATALIGGILVSHHTFAADLVLLIPATSILLSQMPQRTIRLLCFSLLLPVWFFLPTGHVLLVSIAPMPWLMAAVLLVCALQTH